MERFASYLACDKQIENPSLLVAFPFVILVHQVIPDWLPPLAVLTAQRTRLAERAGIAVVTAAGQQ